MALMCRNGFLEEELSAMVASKDSLMLSSMAACVSAPLMLTDELLCIGLKASTGDARLMLLVFFAYPFAVEKVFLVSTGVVARLWLRVFLAVTA